MNTAKEQKNKPILERFKERKVQDFSYAILFLLVSSFFAFYVIRPVLAIAVSLNKEGKDLERINKVYEDNIAKVLQLQADLELVRPKSHLLNEALPDSPKLDALVLDVRKAAVEQNITLTSVSIEGIQLKGAAKNTQKKPVTQNAVHGVKLDMSISGNYEDAVRFVQAIAKQRRIKTIESIEIARDVKDQKATGSASTSTVHIKMNVQAYYL